MFKRIAVHVDNDPACESRVSAAVMLANVYGAQIGGICVQEPPVGYGYDEVIVPSAVMEVLRQQLAERRHKCEQQFARWTSSAGTGKYWVAVEGLWVNELVAQGRCNDILILSQADLQTHRSSIAPYQLESVIMTVGRPVLTIPYTGPMAKPVERVLLCWDGGRESARAIADAAPFLAKAKEIVVLSLDEAPPIVPGIKGAKGGLDAYLQAHGYVEPKHASGTTSGIGIGSAILNTASDYGSDLIVMGLYGHSRAREWVLGGASREMLSCMTIPVLFSH